MRGNSTVEDLRVRFCRKMNLNASETRLLLNGERLDDNSSLQNLKMENGDVIDVFSECSGGGPPGKKILLNSDKQILDALNDSTDSELSDEGNFEKESLDDMFDDEMNDNLKGTKDDNKIDKLSPIKEKIMQKSNQVMQQVHLCKEPVASPHPQVTSSELILPGHQQITPDQPPLNLVQQPVIPVQHRVTAVLYPINSVQKTGTSVKESLNYVSQLVTSPESTGKEHQLPLAKATLDTKESDDTDSNETDLDNNQDDVEFQKCHQRKLLKDNNCNIVAEDLDNSKEVDESDTSDDNWLESLRSKFDEEGFPEKSSLHMKLKFYLEFPKLTDAEKIIVKNLKERIEIHSAWEMEKQKLCPPKKKKEWKRKKVEPEAKNPRCSKRKRGSDENVTGLVKAQKASKSGNIDETATRKADEQDETNPNSTPKQRKHIFRMFGIVSPFIRQKVPTEEETRRFSLAVHLWAVKVKGGVQFMQQNQLTERNFQEILVFAGQSSRWKLIPDRSVIQYKNLWQNAVKGSEYFHGDGETGFETRRRLHDPSLPFCPFGHCMIDSVPICKANEEYANTSSAIRRKLFTPEKKSNTALNQEELSSVQRPSPTKEELKEQNRVLQQEMNLMNLSKKQSKTDTNLDKSKEVVKFSQPRIVECNQVGCNKTFITVFGLEQHMKKMHGEIQGYKKPKQACPFCGKVTAYVDQHIKTAHKEMKGDDTCEVCKQKVKQDMKKHRSICIFCPFCGYENKKKDRLLKHIASNHHENSLQSMPMDLTSPRKESRLKVQSDAQNPCELNPDDGSEVIALDLTSPNKSEKGDLLENQERKTQTVALDLSPPDKAKHIDDRICDEKEVEEPNSIQIQDRHQQICHSQIEVSAAATNMKRTKYPFDDESEAYTSEFEEDDDEQFTLDRRNMKDELEKELRQIDEMKAVEVDGDLEVLKQFEIFMKNKTNRNQESEGYNSDVSTVRMYTSSIKNDLFPAFHKLFDPFDSRWILDCTTSKECTFEGKQRLFVKPEEPIYITSKIVQTALDISKEKGGQQGGQRGTILNATVQFMNFIEIFFNQRLNLYGRAPYESVLLYHQGVRTFISGTGAWKMCNDEKDRAQNENRVRESYQHPNKEVEVLQRYKKYINSTDRLRNINKILIHSENEEKKPSDKEMTAYGKIVMGEIAAATGCRPVVLLKLTNGAYIDKQPGFNPYRTTKDDCIVDEESGADKIYRRVNPNLPPKNRACQHQLEGNVAECPELCEDRCEPDGYNLFITWDKTYGTKGPSYLHIPKELKHMMDIYDIKRIRFFKGRKSPFTTKEDWIHEDSTPFFLNSACSPFKQLDLKHVTEAFGIDVTAYHFRKIVSTWAISHASAEIREAEEEALQHSLKVAKDKYLQNKQLKPQKLTQRYVEEENLFPKAVKKNIEETSSKVNNAIKRTEDKRTKKRIETLIKRKEAYTILKSDNRPLGPKHRILLTQRKQFSELMKKVKDIDIETSLNDLKPLEWRHMVVRTVCTIEEEKGRELQELWKQMYQGDLKWGVRDARLKAEVNNWPMNQVTRRRDRNSWIAASLRQSLISQKTKKVKKQQEVTIEN